MGPGAGYPWGLWIERRLSAAGQLQGEQRGQATHGFGETPGGLQQERVHASLIQDVPAGALLVSQPGWAFGKRDRALGPTSIPRLSGLASDPITPSDCKEIFGIEGLFWFVLESGWNEN